MEIYLNDVSTYDSAVLEGIHQRFVADANLTWIIVPCGDEGYGVFHRSKLFTRHADVEFAKSRILRLVEQQDPDTMEYVFNHGHPTTYMIAE